MLIVCYVAEQLSNIDVQCHRCRCVCVCVCVCVHKYNWASQSEPHIYHSYEKITVPTMYLCMYVAMYVAIHRPRVHHTVCTCAYRNLVKSINVDRMLTH